MKKIICALLGGFLSANAFGATGVANPDDVSVRVNIPWRFIEAVLRENADLLPDLEYMRAEYDKRVAASDDGKLTTGDMLHICAAGRIIHNSVVCYDRVVLPVFNKMGAVMWTNACANKNIKNHAHCVGGLFSKSYGIKSGDSVKNYKTTLPYAQDVNVPQYTAFGFAIEYIRDQGFELDNITCTPTITDNWINCTAWQDSTSMNSNFFSFHFAGVHNTADSTIEENVVRGLCALNKADFMENDCGTFASQREKESDCRMGCDTNCTGTYDSNENSRRFHNQIQRFNLKSDYSANSIIQRIPGNNNPILTAREDDKRFCKIWIPEKWGGGDAWNGDVRRYPGYEYMSDAFKDVQVVYDDALKNILEAYVRAQGVAVNSFECRWLPANYSGTLIEGMAGPADNIATCDINGVPVDFIFDDLFESKNKQLVIGKDALKCLLLPREAGGTASFDGKHCIGPDQAQCTELGKKVNGGTRWDEGTGMCVMKNAAAIKQIEKGFVCLGVGAFAGGVTVLSGGTAVPVLLAAGKGVAACAGYEAGMYILERADETADHDFVKGAIKDLGKCNVPQGKDVVGCTLTAQACVKEPLAKFGAILTRFYDSVSDADIKAMDDAMEYVEPCVRGDSRKSLYADAALMIPQQAAVLQGKHVWLNITITVLSVGTMFFVPTRWLSKLNKFKRLKNLLEAGGAKSHGIYEVNLPSGKGVEVNRINVKDLNESEIVDLLKHFDDRGIQYTDYRKLKKLKVSDLDNFIPSEYVDDWARLPLEQKEAVLTDFKNNMFYKDYFGDSYDLTNCIDFSNKMNGRMPDVIVSKYAKTGTYDVEGYPVGFTIRFKQSPSVGHLGYKDAPKGPAGWSKASKAWTTFGNVVVTSAIDELGTLRVIESRYNDDTPIDAGDIIPVDTTGVKVNN